MTILHVIEPFAAGITTFVQQITTLLPNDKHIIIHGERKDIISPEEVIKNFPDNVQFIKWKSAQREIRLFKDLAALMELNRYMKRLEYDVVHLHSSKAGFLGRLVCKYRRLDNVIYSPNGGSFLRTDIGKNKRKFFIKLERFANIFSGVVICSSKTELEAFEKVRIVAKYINNGTYITDVTEKESNGKFQIVCCGNVTFQKHPDLFNAIAKKFENNTNFQFTWIGDGAFKEKLNSKNIEVTGWLNKEKVAKYLGNADLYISCSLWEGLPYAVMEAMNQRKCLLLTPCVGNDDLLIDGYNGYQYATVEQAEQHISKLFENRDLLDTLSENSRNFCIEKFNAEECINQYREEYLRLINLGKSNNKEKIVEESPTTT